jgi:hypothetical protein
MTDRAIDPGTAEQAPDARTALAGLRPQPYGDSHPGRVVDPLIEPLWAGVRVLAAVEDGTAALADEAGEPIEGQSELADALVEAAPATRLVLDGFLTKLATREGGGVYVAMDNLPSAREMVARPLLGIRPTRAEEVAKRLEAAQEARTFRPEDTIHFIATDLLWLDGELLLDVPLLERRRLLESVLAESDLVRRGVFVRPPIEAWLGSWRSLGFTWLTYKAANSRYRPGVATTEWVAAPMPRR